MAKARQNSGGGEAGAQAPEPDLSPSPKTNMLIRDVLLASASLLARKLLDREFAAKQEQRVSAKGAARSAGGKRTMLHTLVTRRATKIATRSLPGAAAIGSALLVKTLYDRGRAKRLNRQRHHDTSDGTGGDSSE